MVSVPFQLAFGVYVKLVLEQSHGEWFCVPLDGSLTIISFGPTSLSSISSMYDERIWTVTGVSSSVVTVKSWAVAWSSTLLLP